VSGRVFTGSDIGWIYSLDAKTGCHYWGYETGITVRGALSVGPVTGQGAAKYAVYFGDAKGNVYALNAQDGKLLWKRKVDEHFLARITAAPKLYDGRLFVPVSNSEEWQSGNLDYECCSARGSVVALDANTGEQVWKTYVVGETKPTQKNINGVQLYGPAGGAVWNSPTVDPVRRAVYFGTGDSETEPAQPMADGIMAVTSTPQVLWSHQTRPWAGCGPATIPTAKHAPAGPDADIGNPILRTLPDGRVLINGTKWRRLRWTDNRGKLIWRVAANTGGGRGGIVWGGASDHENVYYGMGSGGMAALKMANGQQVWLAQCGGDSWQQQCRATMIPA
jgi:polyvinyl alcohol dehydrogenase (cytochrome)